MMTELIEEIRTIALAIDGHTLHSKPCRDTLISYKQIDTLICYIATQVCERMSHKVDDTISMRPIEPAEMTQHLLNGIPVSQWLSFYHSLDNSNKNNPYNINSCIKWIGPLTNKATKNGFPQIRRHRRTESRLEGNAVKASEKPRFDRLIQATARNDERMGASSWVRWKLKKRCKLNTCLNPYHFLIHEIKPRKRKRDEP